MVAPKPGLSEISCETGLLNITRPLPLSAAALCNARQARLEEGKVVRLDSTVTAALLHEPSDSSLLRDAVRVMVRLLRQVDGLVGTTGFVWHDHQRAAKRRAHAIQYSRGRPKRVQLYRALIGITRATLAYLQQAAARLAVANTGPDAHWQAQVRHYQPLIEQIIAQSERRVSMSL